MKKILLIFICILSFIYKSKIYAYDSFIVMDSKSLRVLDGKNIDKKLLIASTTKIMTAIVALENEDTTKILCAGDEIEEVYGSMIYIKKGECMTLYDLLVGLLLRSGNDSAMVIAENTLGYDAFIEKMNETAIRIGMKNTIFRNSHGLDNKTENYSSPYDLAILMAYANKNKVFTEINKIKKYTLTSSMENYIWYNKNELLTKYKYTTGGKTGYTDKSGYILVSSAKRASEELIIVTFNDKNRFNTHKKLYEKYFNSYDSYKILDKYTFVIKDDYYKKYHLYIKNDVFIMLNKNELDKVTVNIELIKKKKIKNNMIVGYAKIYVNGKFIKSEAIYLLNSLIKYPKLKGLLSNVI